MKTRLSGREFYDPPLTAAERRDVVHAKKHVFREAELKDIPELTPSQLREIVRRASHPRPTKQQLTVRLDQDVVTWVRSFGPGYQTTLNRLLRLVMDATGSR